MKTLTEEQVQAIIDWMNEWKQLKKTIIPSKFKEDFKPTLKTEYETETGKKWWTNLPNKPWPDIYCSNEYMKWLENKIKENA